MIRHSASSHLRTKDNNPSSQNKVLIVASAANDALRLLTQAADIHISTVTSAAAATELCQQESFYLALIDVHVAGHDAMELARSLFQQFELRSIFLANEDRFEMLTTADEVGALGILAGERSNEHLLLTMRVGIARAQELRALANRESQLTTALSAEREINTAIGILMERLQVPRTEAFETLRRYARSQRQQMAQIAAKMLQSVNETNELLSLIGAMCVGKNGSKSTQ